METRAFGTMPDGVPVEELILAQGTMSCGILTYGGALRFLRMPDQEGAPVDVVLGLDSLEAYRTQDKYLGALIGRYANRIGGSSFSLEGEDYPLWANDGSNHLHGGLEGFDKRVWAVQDQSQNAVTLTLTSADGEEGYPGALETAVTYTLQDGALELSYQAKSTKTTLCNLTNHAYFNLSGHDAGSIAGQYIQILAGRYTPVGEDLIPTGAVDDVTGSAMDLRFLQPIGTREFDHNWAIDGWDNTLRPAALAWSPATGITLSVQTTLPGIQFYTGNFLDGCPAGKDGVVYRKHGAFCLETQYFPDSPHHERFPSPVLRAGETYTSKTVYRFRTGKKE